MDDKLAYQSMTRIRYMAADRARVIEDHESGSDAHFDEDNKQHVSAHS